jgi:periplasmic copper chaperone A
VVKRRVVLLASAALAWPPHVAAHGSRVGDLAVDHPYATPTPAGARNGAAFFRRINNRGKQADRLVAASTPVAQAVEFHRSVRDGDVMRMRPLDAIDVPAQAEISLRHDGDTHLMLVGLKEPLRDGQRFPMRLRFERAGEVEVTVWVQTPRAGAGAAHRH